MPYWQSRPRGGLILCEGIDATRTALQRYSFSIAPLACRMGFDKISLKTNSGQEIRKYIKVAISSTQVPNCAIPPITPPMVALVSSAADSPQSGVENKADASPHDSTAALGHEEPVQHTGESITIADDEELPDSAEQAFPSDDLIRIPTTAATLEVPYVQT
ncbi:unnamed protein product [Strongylus vulgaris]|uniref:Uncharacterized protein n=1 Tax=Strongylus vulgaris TaxID=40348 RepID=A0A3P7JHS8_STRVU|nr:unnamed protein product [Strongylus vulgaris]